MIHNVSEDALIIQQANETWFINKKVDGIEMKCEFLTTDGYEAGISVNFNNEESKSLIEFLKQNNFY